MEWIELVALAIATALIIGHAEWRHRRTIEWLDAIGEMVSDYIALTKDK